MTARTVRSWSSGWNGLERGLGGPLGTVPMTDTRQTETTSLWSDGEPSRAPIGLLAPGTALGERYEIRSVLGHGGFAVVYLAHDRQLGRDVALKVLREDRLSPGSLSRLKREVRVARDLAHPNLVRVFDIEGAGSAVFVTLEAITGGSLRDRMAKGPLPVEQAVAIAAEIFRGLAALHGIGIVHRDVKPGNVLLTGDGTVKLADFGLALQLQGDDTRVTATETTVGTLEYLARTSARRADRRAHRPLRRRRRPLRDARRPAPPLRPLLARQPHRPLPREAGRDHRPAPRGAALARPGAHTPARARPSATGTPRPPPYSTTSNGGTPPRCPAAIDGSRQPPPSPPSRSERSGSGSPPRPAAGASLMSLPTARASSSASTAGAARSGGAPTSRAPATSCPSGWEPGAATRLAATLDSPDAPSLDRSLRLDILDPQSGQSVDHLTLPDGSLNHFQGFSRSFGCRIAAVDVDGDARDELVVVYSHRPFWPSFSVFVEPTLRRARTIFVGTGHHHFLGAEDLDGDGRRELLFGGINNRMGWRVGLAAVRVGGDETEPEGFGGEPSPALSGDRFSRAYLADSLLWYAVGPRRLLRDGDRALTFDSAPQRLTLHFFGGEAVTYDADGFPFDHPGALGREQRLRARRNAMLAAGEGERLLESDHAREALPFLEEAAALARAVGDLHLEGWIVQLGIEADALAGRDLEAEHALETALSLEPEAASEAALTAARAWHRAGALERAAAAYRRAETLPGFSTARPAWETLEGRVLALVELGRFDEARAVVRGYERSHAVDARTTAPYEAFVDWRAGGALDPARIEVGPGTIDLHRYWRLEGEAAHGADPEALLAKVRAERATQNGIAPLLDSLESDAPVPHRPAHRGRPPRPQGPRRPRRRPVARDLLAQPPPGPGRAAGAIRRPPAGPPPPLSSGTQGRQT